MDKRPFKVFNFNPATSKFTCQPVTNTKPVLQPTDRIALYGQNIHDVIMVVFTCKVHQKILLSEHQKRYFLPFYSLVLDDAWMSQLVHHQTALLKTAGYSATQCTVRSNLLQFNQIGLPKYMDYVHQLVAIVEVTSGCGGQCAKALSAPFKWFKNNKVTSDSADIFGPEPYSYLTRPQYLCKSSEMSIVKDCMKQSKKKWDVIRSLEYTEKELATLYGQYLVHCYPSRFMDRAMLAQFVSRCKLSLCVNSKVHDEKRLFNSFCYLTGQYVTFKDVLLNLVAMEPRLEHGGNAGEIRTQCIFRYYSKFGATKIAFDELVQLYEDIAAAITNPIKGVKSPKELAEALFKEQRLDTSKQSLSMERFTELVGSLAIRGTSTIFRAKQSPRKEIRALKCTEQSLSVRLVTLGQEKKPLPYKRTHKCDRCSEQVYSLAIHSIVYNTNNFSINYSQELPSGYTIKLAKELRDRSLELVKMDTHYNVLRNVLRHFCESVYHFPKKESIPSVGSIQWDRREDRMKLAESIIKVCIDAKAHFRSMSRVIKCTSPVYVFGDIHGNFKDLMIYDQLLWRTAPNGVLCQSLFLGDYVDRGNNSFECILYLLCMMLLRPDKFHLLRGNHEMRAIQRQFTFYKECLDKFGGGLGRHLWEAFNQVFDYMPLCAIIDEQIYCAHGGIPASTLRVEDLFNIPVPIVTGAESPRLGWEVLWNDPVSQTEYNAFFQTNIVPLPFPLFPVGFLPNTKRGTAYYYTQLAVDNFIDQNDLACVIRGHEVIPAGYDFIMNGKVLTIFSCSNYCGQANESAMVFVEGGKMRVIKMETNQTVNFQ